MLPDLANIAHYTHRALVLGVVLGPVECTFLERCPAVDWRVAGCADLELGELVELDLHRVVRVPLALSLGLLSL